MTGIKTPAAGIDEFHAAKARKLVPDHVIRAAEAFTWLTDPSFCAGSLVSPSPVS
jgi:hypothetical protein